MAESKKPINDKPRQILNIVFAGIAVCAAVVTLLLTPFGKRLIGKDTTAASAEQSSSEIFLSENSTTVTDSTVQASDTPSVSVPKPTKPQVDSYKNYTFFIDKKTFNYVENDGVTMLTAKNNSDVTMTVTPMKSVSYTKLCEETAKTHQRIRDNDILKNLENLSVVYGSEKDGLVTTIYCVDDGTGGCIEIKCQYPTSAAEYEKDFKILLSMFKVL